MEKTNFYLLLELSIDPPENDIKVIEQAIKKKQAEWSRFRNHPTKGIQAKHYLGLLSDIKSTMLDPMLRQQEAQEAQSFLEKQEKGKISEVDRHLSLLLSKGGITDEEIAELGKQHNIAGNEILKRIRKIEILTKLEQQVRPLIGQNNIGDKEISKLAKQYPIVETKLRDWVQKKKEETFTDIDRYMSVCAVRGYITQKEIAHLSALYMIPEKNVLKRVKCPIKKDGLKKTAKISPLDPTIEKIINDNLKIVGKVSLYNFLDLSHTADLQSLNQRAKEKEAELRQSSQKDAVTTASSILVGHCIAIFRSEESRKSYDWSRTRQRISEISSDIQVAGITGKILAEYYDSLLRTALKLAVTFEEAEDYIRDIAQSNKFSIELNPKKKRNRMLLVAVAILCVILIVGSTITMRIVKSHQMKNAYERVITHVDEESKPEQKLFILEDYLKYHGNSPYAPEIKQKILEIRDRMQFQEYELMVKEANQRVETNDLNGALALYNQYLAKFPDSTHAGNISKKVEEIYSILDDRAFQALSQHSNASPENRMAAYQTYFKNHPNSKHVQEVNQLIALAMTDIFERFKKNISQCEKHEDWDQCIQLCNQFIDTYGETDQTSEVKGIRVKYERKIQNEADIAQLKQKAAEKGKDYAAAKEVYFGFLNASPETSSYIRGIISKEVAILDRKIEQQAQEQKEWTDTLAFCTDAKNDVGDRFNRISRYVRQNSNSPYLDQAQPIFDKLKSEKQEADERLRLEKERNEWSNVLSYIRDASNSVTKRYYAVANYIKKYPSGVYTADATTLLTQLENEKLEEEARNRAQQEALARLQREKQNIRSQLGQSGGRYVEVSDGVVQDRQTGLMWAMVDSFADLGRCIDFDTAQEYAGQLRIGGYKDWRLPTVNELAGIYKTSPFFPSTSSKWYWSSDLYWHGWNKKAYIVTTVRETAWSKQNVELSNCGVMRAVRK